MNGTPYSEEETARLMEMWRGSLLTQKEIAAVLGRTLRSVRHRIEYVTMTPERREEVKERVNASRRERDKTASPLPGADRVAARPTIPPEVIDDRNRRLMAARDLTAMLMGDPPQGYSALGRRP